MSDFLAISLGGVVGAQYVQGEKQRKLQKEALEDQRKTQAEQQARAINQRSVEDMRERQLNQQQPDIATLLANAAKPQTPSSLLTGPGGVDPSKLNLGRPKLLGE
jgi:hypothetical protein